MSKCKPARKPAQSCATARFLRMLADKLDRGEIVDFDTVTHWYSQLDRVIVDDKLSPICGPC